MEGLAVLGAAFVLIVVSYLGLSAVLRRIPVTSPRLPTGPIPGSWYGVLDEFAHQLDAEDGAADGAPILPPGALRTWGGVLSEEYERLRRDAADDRRSALDDYGATNKAEFFAVATEAFFEKPVQLEREHPALYTQLRQFYRQDPARRAAP